MPPIYLLSLCHTAIPDKEEKLPDEGASKITATPTITRMAQSEEPKRTSRISEKPSQQNIANSGKPPRASK